jgi:hypothetical protein
MALPTTYNADFVWGQLQIQQLILDYSKYQGPKMCSIILQDNTLIYHNSGITDLHRSEDKELDEVIINHPQRNMEFIKQLQSYPAIEFIVPGSYSKNKLTKLLEEFWCSINVDCDEYLSSLVRDHDYYHSNLYVKTYKNYSIYVRGDSNYLKIVWNM